MDMLCESRVKIGMLGFCYFAGVVAGLVFAHPLTDIYGKKSVFCCALLLSILGQAALLFLSYYTYLGMFFLLLVGLSWAGKTIVGISYILDFFPIRTRPKDLALDSLDVVEVVMAVEEEFAIEIPDAEADKILSVADAVEYISSHPQAK